MQNDYDENGLTLAEIQHLCSRLVKARLRPMRQGDYSRPSAPA